MYRLIFGVLGLLPWWVYAALSVMLASSAFNLWENNQQDAARAEIAVLEGPPPVQKVDDLDGRMRADRFADVRVAGFLRADLGIGRIEGTVPKSYVVLGGTDPDSVVLAVMFVGTEDQNGLSDLIATADDAGLVVASGFRRTLDRAEVAGQLRLKGVRQEVVLIEAIVGGRAAALRDRATSDLWFVYVVAGLALICAVTAYVRRSRKVQRRRTTGRPARPAPVSQPAPTPRATAKPQPKPQSQPKAAPWGGRPPQAAPAVSRTREAAPDPMNDLPPFESVFPGGGSGFRFKTADEIIRETFGTVSRLSPPDRDS